MHLKYLVTHFQKMVLLIMLWLTVSEMLVRVLSQGILLNYCWVSIYILIANILLTVNVNFFNILRFLAKVSSKLQKKCTFLENLKAIAQERNMETRQMAPFSSSAFPALTVIFIFVFENSQNLFSCGPPLVPSSL